MRLVQFTAAAVSIFVYCEGRGEGFFLNDRLVLEFGRLRCFLWSFFGESGIHGDGWWWSHVGSEVLNKLFQIELECISWRVEMVRRRVGIGR